MIPKALQASSGTQPECAKVNLCCSVLLFSQS